MKGTVSVFLVGWILLAQSALASPPHSSLEEEEYAVYVALITDKFLGKNKRVVVIENRTSFNAGDEIIFFMTKPDLSRQLAPADERYSWLGEKLGGISLETLTDFRAKDTRSYQVSPRLKLPAKYTLLSAEKVTRLFQHWQGDRKDPHSNGAFRFSRVGFNSAKTEALVYVGFSCGRHCSSYSRFVVLTRTTEGWSTKSDYVTWIS